ncbi:nitrate reductase cytochrome c-type subunit [Pseudoneobacillus sp. C159]
MKAKELIFLVSFVIVLLAALGIAKLTEPTSEKVSSVANSTQVQPIVVTQLEEEGREKAATMVLVGAPPMQPADHIDRWNPKLHQDSCMACHSKPETGAPTPPANHFYNDNTKDKVFRDNCQQCHATQNDTKTAFNSK